MTMDILSFLKSETKRRQSLIERLLSKGQISTSEAALLLKTTERIHINKVEMSSGAKIVMGDDNETDYNPL